MTLIYKPLPETIITLDEIKALQQRCDLLRTALEEVEWVSDWASDGEICAWCKNVDYRGHTKDCPRQLALAA